MGARCRAPRAGRRLGVVAVTMAALAAGLVGCAPAQSAPPAGFDFAAAYGFKRIETYSYGPRSEQVLDLYVPQGAGPHPVVVWMAGGGWVEGPYTAVSQVILRLTRLGVAVVSIRYRLANETNHFPDPVVDLKTAASWLSRHAGELDLDPARMVSSGYSSGGHLAMLGAVTFGNPDIQPMEGPEVRFIGSISFAGAVLMSHDLNSILSGPAKVFLGCVTTTCVDPDRASPMRYFDIGDPPILGLWGDADFVEPAELGLQQDRAARAAGMESQFELFPGLTHADIGDAADFNVVYDWLQRLFASVEPATTTTPP